MSVYPNVTVDYQKEYMLKNDCGLSLVLNPVDFSHFQEGSDEKVTWKWIDLPIKTGDKKLNKLVLNNDTNEEIDVTILIRYEIFEGSNIPLVYFSPTREALVMFDGNEYRIFGGISPDSHGDRFSTIPVDVNQWMTNSEFIYQPLSKESKGWGLEFHLRLLPMSPSYIYEWEFKGENLHEIEETHTQYQRLLGKAELTY